MAESVSDAEKARRASSIVLSGGDFVIIISYDNEEVASQVEKEVSKTGSTGALYRDCDELRPILETAVKKALGGERDDQEVRNIEPGSLHVLLRCLTDERFLEVLTEYESGRMKERLLEEFSWVEIQVEGLMLEIQNMVKVNETKEAINERYGR